MACFWPSRTIHHIFVHVIFNERYAVNAKRSAIEIAFPSVCSVCVRLSRAWAVINRGLLQNIFTLPDRSWISLHLKKNHREIICSRFSQRVVMLKGVWTKTRCSSWRYLQNDTRYGLSYNIDEYELVCVLSNHIEWHWVTFQGHDIFQRQITRKQYKLELYLQWQTDRKWYMIYRILPLSVTLNDP